MRVWHESYAPGFMSLVAITPSGKAPGVKDKSEDLPIP